MRYHARHAWLPDGLASNVLIEVTDGRFTAVKRNMPRKWFDDLPHTHGALDDAIEQGALFCNMLKDNRERLGAGR